MDKTYLLRLIWEADAEPAGREDACRVDQREAVTNEQAILPIPQASKQGERIVNAVLYNIYKARAAEIGINHKIDIYIYVNNNNNNNKSNNKRTLKCCISTLSQLRGAGCISQVVEATHRVHP